MLKRASSRANLPEDPSVATSMALTGSIALVAAGFGAAELLLHRVATPILAHVPHEGPSTPAVSVAWAGERALGGTAILVGLLVLMLAAGARRHDRGLVAALLLGIAGTALALIEGGRVASLAGHLAVGAAVVLVAGPAAFRLGGGRATVLAFAASAMLAGQWFFASAELEGLTSASSSIGGGMLTPSLAEAALVLTPIAAACAELADRSPSRVQWLVAVLAAVSTSALLARSPGYTAIVSLWATGVTLALPAVLYVASVSSAALVLSMWLVRAATRPLAAGLVLLAVAGVAPGAVHHNLTAVAAVALLAWPTVATAARPVAAASGISTTAGLAPHVRMGVNG